MFKVTASREMNRTFARAFNSRDIGNLLALYESDAVLRSDGTQRAAVGKRAISEELEGLLQLPGTMVSNNNFCIEHGELALLRADWTLLNNGGSVIASGSSAEIIRRQPDGAWLYVIDHAVGASLPVVANQPDAAE